MPTHAHVPQRTCIATNTTAASHSLLRLSARQHEGVCHILADPAHKLGGRGAWITPTIEALEQATRRRAFARAFRVSTPVDTGHLREYLAAHTAHDPDTVRKTQH
ncbi:YlxR family protein [Corynebacterium pseudopelargi]|uniref:YlxR family protein n=1 Tax=Corynebacterium pseudopelargi TaxID=2080757 RepID=UPI000F4EEC95|nr:YlxR family protein [Corynebacterium pseudopelargi]